MAYSLSDKDKNNIKRMHSEIVKKIESSNRWHIIRDNFKNYNYDYNSDDPEMIVENGHGHKITITLNFENVMMNGREYLIDSHYQAIALLELIYIIKPYLEK